MREIVEIVRQDTAPDGFGGLIPTEVQVLKTYAKVRFLSSSRKAEANQAQINQVIEVRIWKRAAYTPEVGQTIIYRQGRYSITAFLRTNECPQMDILTATAQ